jgi:phage-related protein
VEKKETEERNLGERITNQHTVLSELNTSLNKLLAETGNHSDTQQSSQDISWKLDTEPLNRAVKKTVANAEDLQKMIDKARELTEEKIKETNEKFKNIEMDFDSAKESLKLIETAVTNVTRQLDNARKNFKKTKNNSAEEQA